MKKWLILVLALILVGGVGYANRGDLRDRWDEWRKPELPLASRFNPDVLASTKVSGDQNTPIEGGVATSQNYVLVSSPTGAAREVNPFADTRPLPSEANLDVPFMSQAPKSDWSLPYQEACEEASVIMVDAYYRGIEKISIDEATKAINSLVDYENKTLGFYKDTDAQDTAAFIKGYFKYADVLVVPLTDITQIKRAVANGFPVILPADGKLLKNPNFRNGGPPFHMIVVKGYSKEGIITNDPGTRKGADYVYDPAVLMNAAHDWDGVSKATGPRVMIIVIPNPKS